MLALFSKISYTYVLICCLTIGCKEDILSEKYENLKGYEDFYVYTHSVKKKGVVYVGMGRVDRAWMLTKRNKLWETFFADCEPEVKIVERNLTLEGAESLERTLIAYYLKDKGFLLNIYAGSRKCRPITNERASELLSKYNARYWKGKARTKESIQKGVDTKNERDSHARYWKGKKRDPELMRKLKAASMTPEAQEKKAVKLRGQTRTPEQKARMSEAGKGRVMSEEAKLKISQAKTGRPNGLEGHKWTDEARANLSKARIGIRHDQETLDRIKATKAEKVANGWVNPKSKAVLCVELNKQFINAKEAAKAIDKASAKHIQACCVGRRLTHAGHTWKYV